MKTSVTATAAVTAAMAALALSACGQSGASDSSTASAAASVSQAPASKGSVAASSDGMMALLPMGSLVIQVPADAVTGTTTTYDDGMQQTYYDSRGSVPLTVAVERYAAGTKPAASMLAAEQQALAAQSIQPKVTPVEVPGGSGGNRLDWQVKAIPPSSVNQLALISYRDKIFDAASFDCLSQLFGSIEIKALIVMET